MTPKIATYMNRKILVSIPSLFEDGKCRIYKLVGVDLHGLWLESDDLTERLLPDEKDAPYAGAIFAVFVPFTQIAGVMAVTTPPNLVETSPGEASKSSGEERKRSPSRSRDSEARPKRNK